MARASAASFGLLRMRPSGATTMVSTPTTGTVASAFRDGLGFLEGQVLGVEDWVGGLGGSVATLPYIVGRRYWDWMRG